MDYLKILHENPDLADEFDSLFDFFLLDELSPRDDAEGRCTFSLPGKAFARDGSGGEYHLLEDGSIGYYSSEGEAGRLAESMDDLFSLIVSCICWHDCCVMMQAGAWGKITLPDIVSDNMVLQQQTEACLWGKANANAEVIIRPS